jgi:hypothetical protein
MASIERIGVLDALDDWKLTAQTSIATIRQKVSSQGASIALLTEWRGSVEDDILSVASIEQRVTDAEAAIKLLTELNMGDTSSLAELVNRVTATEASIASLTSWKNGAVDSIAKIEQISTEDYSSITGLAKFKSDTAANEARIEGKADRNGASISTLAEWKNSVSSDVSSISGIRATANANAASLVGLSEFKTNTTTSLARIEGKADTNGASIGLVVDNGKVKGGVLVEAINNESAAKISADRLDIEGKTLNIKVASTNIVGGLTIGQLPSNVATRENIPTDVSQLSNGAGYQTSSGVVSIIDGRITADFIKTLGLEVGNQIKMGAGATISWDSVSSKPTNLATTTDVSNAQAGAINEVKGLGYQTLSQVKTEISGSKIRTDQIECTDLNAFGATIGGFTIDNNSLHSSMNSTSNRILLCSGTSARYTVGGYSSTGWRIIAGSNFGVLKNGAMYASGANISGIITATSGLVGNCRIEDGGIVSANSNFVISPEGDIYANGGIIGGWKIGEGIIHSTSGVYGTYSYSTTGTNLKYATGYAFTLLTPSGICYYINQSNDFNSKTLAIIYNPIGGNGVSGETSGTV